MRHLTAAALACLVAAPAWPADLAAGAELAEQCAACHGEAGISVTADTPNLAAQKVAYLTKQLKDFRSGARRNDLMNAVAGQLSDADIDNAAAHFASLPGGDPGAMGQISADLDGHLVSFPADFQQRLVRYDTIDFEARKQVRHYWGTPEAVAAAKAGGAFPAGAYMLVEIYKAQLDADGKPVKGADGRFVQTDLTGYTAMQKIAGAGSDVPKLISNGDWRYGVFDAKGAQRAGVNEAPCMACHQPLDETDYSFTYKAMAAFAPKG